MRQNEKDVATVVSTGLVVAIYIAFLYGVTMPLITSVRGTAGLVLAVAWIGGYPLSGLDDVYSVARKPSVVLNAAQVTLAAVALVAALCALATASRAALTVLVAATVLLWLVATLRHLLKRLAAPAGAPVHPIAGGRTSTAV